ncbi:hypothetical protein FH5T_17980 [Draconibacterium orientale]|uniref:Uncharacterized protein n=1 Tax=Draconibacterium orientale TaxID=1168034 RepID=A0ABN4D681_9BACT|nr:hypothetical protein FH5T_17980 [Draconibacterium orientale]
MLFLINPKVEKFMKMQMKKRRLLQILHFCIIIFMPDSNVTLIAAYGLNQSFTKPSSLYKQFSKSKTLKF